MQRCRVHTMVLRPLSSVLQQRIWAWACGMPEPGLRERLVWGSDTALLSQENRDQPLLDSYQGVRLSIWYRVGRAGALQRRHDCSCIITSSTMLARQVAQNATPDPKSSQYICLINNGILDYT